MPDLGFFHRGQRVGAVKVGLNEARLVCSRHDAVTQSVTTQHIVLGRGSIQLYPVQIRYAWPSELELMAKLVGLQLEAPRSSLSSAGPVATSALSHR